MTASNRRVFFGMPARSALTTTSFTTSLSGRNAFCLFHALTCLICAASRTPTATRPAHFQIPSFDYSSFIDHASVDTPAALRRALSSNGILAVTNIPRFAEARRDALPHLDACANRSSDSHTVNFEDGTSRRTLATVAFGNGTLTPLFNTAERNACSDTLVRRVQDFRAIVSETAALFARRVDEVYGERYPSASQESFMYNFEHTRSYDSLADIIVSGEHLDHFHAYRKNIKNVNAVDERPAIDFHSDQGLFIAFTPGMLVRRRESDGSIRATKKSAGEFWIRLQNETAAIVDFENDGDVLVFMLGDGVEQHINPRLNGNGPLPRATPHAMVMPEHSENEWRAWYGRMFLPPGQALSGRHGVTFDRLREILISDVRENHGVGSGLGCSRHLQETDTQCERDQVYCWMRCMDYTETENPETCAEKTDQDGSVLNLQVQCANNFDQVYRPGIDRHGAFRPMCTNSSANISGAPRIEDSEWARSAPEFASKCENWEDFLGLNRYENSIQLLEDNEEGYGSLFFTYTVMSDGRRVEMKMSYKGIAGYLSFGNTNHGGKHNGMNGASVVMGIYDPDKNIDDVLIPGVGLFVGTSVAEYIIDPDESGFEYWKQPIIPGNMTEGRMDVHAGCFTSTTVMLDGAIAGDAFNMSATNSLIWAIQDQDFYKGYHGRMHRGFMCLDFSRVMGHMDYVAAESEDDMPEYLRDCAYGARDLDRADTSDYEISGDDVGDDAKSGSSDADVRLHLGALLFLAFAWFVF
ncbi:hypothetical protein CYMTET_46596 [Cymbomonas tetramitiformis]|uniref:Uncharacterized protein n=1 Tax=Cymbomonas tetramitiformis TaxID=36881 RepID=A0AAE0BVW6_9CHLO|nr:hypothetical protein CYMTET_46596 [Cymbomonas tetramitiformis]